MIIKKNNQEIISIEWFACLCSHKYVFICWDRIMPYFIEYAESLDIFSFFITFETHEVSNLIDFTTFYKDCIFIYPDNIHMENFLDCVLQPNCILFNSEQMSIQKRRKNIENFLSRGGKIINYSLQNQLILKSFENQMLYLPYRCTQRERDVLKTLLLQEKKEFDVALVASMTLRRRNFVDELQKKGIKVCVISNKFGYERDQLIARCDFLLNIHASEEYTIFETIRCNRWLDAGMSIISEPCSDIQANHHKLLKILPINKITDYLLANKKKDYTVDYNIDYLEQTPLEHMNRWLTKTIDPKIDMTVAKTCYGARQYFTIVQQKEIAFLIKKDDNFNKLYGDPAPNVEKNFVILFFESTTRIPETRKENYYVSLQQKNIQIWVPN